MAGSLKILGIAGSLRKASYNRAALRAAQKLAKKGDPKSSIMAPALLKKARNMVASSSSTDHRATEILESLDNP